MKRDRCKGKHLMITVIGLCKNGCINHVRCLNCGKYPGDLKKTGEELYYDISEYLKATKVKKHV